MRAVTDRVEWCSVFFVKKEALEGISSPDTTWHIHDMTYIHVRTRVCAGTRVHSVLEYLCGANKSMELVAILQIAFQYSIPTIYFLRKSVECEATLATDENKKFIDCGRLDGLSPNVNLSQKE